MEYFILLSHYISYIGNISVTKKAILVITTQALNERLVPWSFSSAHGGAKTSQGHGVISKLSSSYTWS